MVFMRGFVMAGQKENPKHNKRGYILAGGILPDVVLDPPGDCLSKLKVNHRGGRRLYATSPRRSGTQISREPLAELGKR